MIFERSSNKRQQLHLKNFHRCCRNSYIRGKVSIKHLLKTFEITVARALQGYVPLRNKIHGISKSVAELC